MDGAHYIYNDAFGAMLFTRRRVLGVIYGVRPADADSSDDC